MALSTEIETIRISAFNPRLEMGHPYLLAAGIYGFLKLNCS